MVLKFSKEDLVIIFLNCFFLIGCNSFSNKEAKNSDSNWLIENIQIPTSIKPHSSINIEEFKRQYLKNKVYWDEAFKFMKENDLKNLKPGNFVIDSGNVYGFVALTSPKPKDSVKWEAHRKFNDLQYVIFGKADMGVAPISDSINGEIILSYNSRTDNENFSLGSRGKYYTADSSVFFIFSPQEIHRPAFKKEGYDTIKKIVIKVKVP